jgi:hypothetical protein
VLGVEGHVEPGLAAFGRELADDVVLRDLAREDLVEQLGGLRSVDAAEAHARTAGQLHVDQRLVGAEADAADFDELDVIAVFAGPLVDRVDRRARARAEAAGAGADVDDGLVALLAAERGEARRERSGVAAEELVDFGAGELRPGRSDLGSIRHGSSPSHASTS